MREEGTGRRRDTAVTKARDKGHDNQPSAGAANARRRRIEQVEDATTNHLWERRAAAGNESKRTAADGGRQKWAATVDNRVDDPTMTSGIHKSGRQQQSR
jgi:hypothetical protein